MYYKINAENQRLQKEIASLEQKLASLPTGSLHYSRDRSRVKFFHSHDNQNNYIPKKDYELARQLAYKKYLSLRLKDLQNEKTALEHYLCSYHSGTRNTLEHFLADPVYQSLLPASCIPENPELDEWVRIPYDRNPNYPEQLIYRTVSGNMVRSKSEVLIDIYLYNNQIPFRYECALTFDTCTLYPDFTILHPLTGATLYWEHFGMMNIPSYSKQAYSKLHLYSEHHILPDHQLITTFESKQNPLLPIMIESKIQQFLLQ